MRVLLLVTGNVNTDVRKYHHINKVKTLKHHTVVSCLFCVKTDFKKWALLKIQMLNIEPF